ncbi:MAG: hypothetical protein JW885_02425 [Deltaproteobacteria bacterium]|nr:hypothetical protein [Candidatus Zymogenaceae bacterium]
MTSHTDTSPKPSRSKRCRIAHKGAHVFFGMLAVVGFALLFGLVVMWLWNWLLPELFGIAAIGYWQAFGLVILARILFGGILPGFHPKSKHRSPWPPIPPRPHDPDVNGGDIWGHMDRRSHRWWYYKKFWKDVGKTAFDEYMKQYEEKTPPTDDDK